MSEENRKLLDELGLPVEFLGAVPGGFHVCEDSPEEEYPLVYTSERFLEILGWSAEEIKENFDNRYSRMVHPDDKDAGEANYSENLGQADAVTEDRVFRMQGKTGYKWVSSTAKTYEANGKRYVCAIHTAINHIVEESKQENQDLQEEKTEVINDIEILKNQLDIIKSVAGVYICLYYVDLSDYSYIELGTTADDVEELIGKKGEAHVAFEQMCRYLVADEFVDAMKEFTKVETVNDRLKNTNWITRQFIDTKGNWTEGWFIAADRDENGNCKHAVWGVRDISEQKNIELAYQNELEETDNIVANAGMGIWTIQMFDGEEPRMQANPMMRELLSLPEDMIDEVEIYHAWYSRIKPEALESVTASVQAMINGERNENTYLWEDPNLGDQYVRCGGVAEKVDGKGYILRGYHYNVNNEVLKEQQSKIASKKTNAILEAVSSDYHTVWLIDDKTLEMNFIRSSGVKTIQKAVAMGANQANYDSAIHKYIHTYVVDEDRERVEKAVKSATVMQEVERQFVYTVNYKRIDDDGNITFHQMAFAKVEGFGFTLAYRDIDDMMQEELQKQQILETALENAEAASRSKSTFLFNMSHDIRTPMNAIMGFTDLLKKNLDDKEVAESYIRKIQSSNEFLLEIINNILDMARIESGKEELDENPVHSEEVCGEVISIFEAQMAGKDIEFTYDIHVEHDYVYADATKLRKTLLNILSNAYKYTNPGGKVTMTVTDHPGNTDDCVFYRAVVEDTGIGMSEDYRKHLFEEFARERTSTESKVIGTGLGLSITKKLIDMMHGTIEVESESGKGTKVIFEIPHRIVKQTDLEVEDETIPELDANWDGKRILLAEDNDLNAEITFEILSERGLIVERAEDGAICVDMLQKASPGYYDLILMDVQMPNMNGYEATKAIRSMSDLNKSNIPIFAMTANAFEEDKKNAFEAGMNGHIAKPINIKEMFKLLSTVLIKPKNEIVN